MNCSWCGGNAPAMRKVEVNLHPTVQTFRYFCSASHQANWETNQPRPERFKVSQMGEGLTFTELAKEANLNGWVVNNCFQYQVWGSEPSWRCNLQAMIDGASKDVHGEFADGETPEEALLAAMTNMECRTIVIKYRPKEASPATLKRMYDLMERVFEGLHAWA